MDIIARFEQQQIQKLTADNAIPDFAPGDTVKVNVKIKEGSTERGSWG